MEGLSGFRKYRLFVNRRTCSCWSEVRRICGLSDAPSATAWFWRSLVMATARLPPDQRSRSNCRTKFFSSRSRIALVSFELLLAAEVGRFRLREPFGHAIASHGGSVG